MALTTDQIFDLDLTTRRGALGKIEAVRRAHRRVGGFGANTRPALGPKQQRFLEAARADRQANPGQVRPRVQHPADVARAHLNGEGGRRNAGRAEDQKEQADLTGAELAWLNNLPRDPRQVTFDDAVRLARMALSINRSKKPSEAMFVDSIWEPIALHHDEAVLVAELAALKEPPGYTAEAMAAAAEVIADELGISHDAAIAEARTRASDFASQRLSTYELDRAKLERRLENVRAQVADRAVVTRFGPKPSDVTR